MEARTMVQLALVPHGAPVVLPPADAPGDAPSSSSPSSSSDGEVRQEIHSIFETYAMMYPNPSLSRERRDRDELQRAAAAASHASRVSKKKKKKDAKRQTTGGFFSFLWRNASTDEDDLAHSQPEHHQSSDNGHQALHLGDQRPEDRQYPLLGTDSLDLRCVPPEAHALARFHLASTRTRGERPNVARPSWQVAGTSVLVVTGLGEVVEFPQAGGEGRLQHTSDRQHLQSYVRGTDFEFQVSYVRAATIGPNLLVVSWGLLDGLVVFYRRLVGKERTTWEAVACMGATEAVKANIKDSFWEEFGSAFLRVTDVVPLIFDIPEAPPAAFVAISRLGGYIEIVRLPTGLWYGPEIDPLRGKKAAKRDSKEHYASTLRDLAADPRSSIIALTTAAHTLDCICLESFQTSATSHTTWDSEAYPDAPPAEYVLAATGISTRGGGEAVCFWSIQACRSDETDTVRQPGKLELSASLTDSVIVGPVGPDYTVFVNQTIMSLWRRPRDMRIHSNAISLSTNTDSEFDTFPVTTISVPAPIVAMSFADEPDGGHYASFLDWNGGCMIADCRLLSGLVSHSLTTEQFELLFNNEDEDVPLVAVTVDRGQMALRIGSHRADDIQFWGGKRVWDEPLLAVAMSTPRAGLCLVSAVDSNTFGMEIPVSFTSLLRYKFAGLVLASSYISDDKSCSVSTSTIKFLANDELDSANKKLWEETKSIDSLQKVSDTEYLIEQALSTSLLLDGQLDDAKCFDLFRAVHSLALTRIIEEAALNAGDNEIETARQQLTDRLVRWGTFELLLGLWSMKKSYERFISDFLSLPILDIAFSLARVNDTDALSILWFRHNDDIRLGLDILNEITPTMSPRLYSHLLPVFKDKIKMFLAVDHDDRIILRDWLQFPDYLKEVGCWAVTVDAEDHSLVLSQPASVVSTGDDPYSWYENRVKHFLSFGSSIENTIELCRLGLEAAAPSHSGNQIPRMLNYLQRLSDYNSTIRDDTAAQFSAFEILSLQCLEAMSLEDLVASLFTDAIDAEILSFKFEHFFLPLAAKFNDEAIQYSILSHFADSFSRIRDGNFSLATVKDLFSLVDRCLACASLSRPSLRSNMRIIRETGILFKFVENTFANVLQISCGLRLNEFQSRRLIEQLWALYECLPTRIVLNEIDIFEDKHIMADDMFEVLVVLSILCQWPGCHAFNLIQGAEGEELYERILGCLCQSFFSQSRFVEGEAASDQGKLSVLLSSLISDIKELKRIVFGPEFSIAKVLTSELVLPLIDRKQVRLLSGLLDHIELKWIDKDTVSQEISSLIQENLHFDGDEESIIEYQSLLSAHFPDVFQHVLEMQQYFEAARLINMALRAGHGSASFKATDISERLPIDIIDDVVQGNPFAALGGCEEWTDVKWAALANSCLRDLAQGRNHLAENVGRPELPDHLVLHLASLLGLSDPFEISVIKYRLIVHNVSAKLYGAAAAICRSIHTAIGKLSPAGVSLLLHSTAAIISAKDYHDKSTIFELCESLLVLSRQQYPLERFYEIWYPAFRMLIGHEAATSLSNDLIPRVLHVTKRLVYDTFQEYNLRIGEIFCALQEQMPQCLVDDTLLLICSRYILYWCISQYTRTKSERPSAVEDAFVSSAVDSFVALLLHVADDEGAQSLIQEAHAILHERSHSMPFESSSAVPDMDIVEGLLHRGYSVNGARKAALATNNAGIDVALQWAVLHALEEGFDDPIVRIQNERISFTNVDGCKYLIDVLEQCEMYREASAEKESHLENMEDSWTAWNDNADTLNVSCSDSTDDASNVGGRSQNENNSTIVASFMAANETIVMTECPPDTDADDISQAHIPEGMSLPSKPSSNVSNVTPKAQQIENFAFKETDRAPLRLDAELDESLKVFTASSPSAGMEMNPYPSSVASTPFSNPSPSRAALLETGQKALKMARSSASPSSEERKRLIEEGRKLLLSRGGLTPSVRRLYPRSSLATEIPKRAPTAEQTDDSRRKMAHESRSPPEVAAETPDTVANHVSSSAALSAPKAAADEWDFDEDDLGGANGGWDFEEDLT